MASPTVPSLRHPGPHLRPLSPTATRDPDATAARRTSGRKGRLDGSTYPGSRYGRGRGALVHPPRQRYFIRTVLRDPWTCRLKVTCPWEPPRVPRVDPRTSSETLSPAPRELRLRPLCVGVHVCTRDCFFTPFRVGTCRPPLLRLPEPCHDPSPGTGAHTSCGTEVSVASPGV